MEEAIGDERTTTMESAPPMAKKARKRPQLTEQEEDEMIEFLRENTFLYDKKRKLYHDRNLRDSAWTRQAAKLSRTKEDLEVWYDSIRTRYGKLLKDMKKSGSGAKDHSDRDKWIMAQLSFLQPFITNRRSSKPLVSIKEKIGTSTPSTLGGPSDESDTPNQDNFQPTNSTPVAPQSATEDTPDPSTNDKKKVSRQEQLADQLRQAGDQQNQLLLLTKDFFQRSQEGDPVRRSFCQYAESVMLKLPNDLYRRASRQIQGILDEALDEVDRREREGQQQSVPTPLRHQQQYQHPQSQPPQYQLPDHQQFMTPPAPPSQWQPSHSQWRTHPMDLSAVWRSQQADWARKHHVTELQPCASAAPVVQSQPAATGRSTPNQPDPPNISSFLRELRDEVDVEKDEEGE